MKITLLLFFLSCLHIFATDYYINPETGNDRNNGRSVSQAFKSLSKINRLSLKPGDNIFLMNGNYPRTGGKLFEINTSGTADNYITVQNYPGHSPLLKFNGWTGIDITDGASYIRIKGLRIQGARASITLEEALAQPGSCQNDQNGGARGLYNGTGILVVGPNLRWSNSSSKEVPHHIEIENCEIFDCTSSGIALQQVDYATVRNNKIYNNAWYTLYGTSGLNMYQFINTDGTTGIHNIIENNLFYGNQLKVPQLPSCQFYDGNALIVDDFDHIQTRNYKDPNITYPAYSATTLVKNNIAVENGGSGLHFYLSSNCQIYNNTVVNNAFQNEGSNGNAELRIGFTNNFDVKNNIFVSEYTVNAVDNNKNLTYSNNYHTGPDINSNFATCSTCPTEGIDFINQSISDESPFITKADSIQNKGVPISLVTTDYLGKERSTLSPDLGAYELGSCAEKVWYVDADGDGIGSENQTIISCDQPDGFVANSGDQCDNNPEVTEPTVWYVDADGDNFGSATDTLTSCLQPDGYVANASDACDNNAEITETTEWYIDADNDGVGSINNTLMACEKPDGYVAVAGDFCDNDPETTEGSFWYVDADGDGIGSNDNFITDCKQPDGYVSVNGDFCDNDPETTEVTIWYADADNDGIGVESDIIEACDQPEGYVANSGDLCATDPDKLEPGECGCNKPEGTCSGSEACNAPAYESSRIYRNSGTLVTYLGRAYRNKWYSRNDLPTAGDPWELVEICDGTGTDCSAMEAWDSTRVYENSGTQVIYNGKVYENKWYSRSDIPDNSRVWKLIDVCSVSSATTLQINNSFELNQLKNSISLYPTLFDTHVIVKSSEKVTLRIFNPSGQLVVEYVNEANSRTLDLSTVSSGLYLVEVGSKSGTFFQKIIKK